MKDMCGWGPCLLNGENRRGRSRSCLCLTDPLELQKITVKERDVLLSVGRHGSACSVAECPFCEACWAHRDMFLLNLLQIPQWGFVLHVVFAQLSGGLSFEGQYSCFFFLKSQSGGGIADPM